MTLLLRAHLALVQQSAVTVFVAEEVLARVVLRWVLALAEEQSLVALLVQVGHRVVCVQTANLTRLELLFDSSLPAAQLLDLVPVLDPFLTDLALLHRQPALA